MKYSILEKEMVTHSSILAGKIPWTEELAGQSHRESDTIEHSTASKQMYEVSIAWKIITFLTHATEVYLFKEKSILYTYIMYEYAC